MIKLTKTDGNPRWINPKYIQMVAPAAHGADIYLLDFDRAIAVQESPGFIVIQMEERGH